MRRQIVERVNALYGDKPDQQNANRCPGEGLCIDWTTGGASFEEKLRNACRLCTRCNGNPPFAPGESDKVQIARGSVKELTARAEELYCERLAGRRFDLDELAPLEWQGLVMFSTAERERDRLFQANLKLMLEKLSMLIEFLLTKS